MYHLASSVVRPGRLPFRCALRSLATGSQHGVALSPGGALGNKSKQDFAGIDSGVSETPTEKLSPNGRLALTCPAAPPCQRQPVPPGMALRLALLARLLRDSGAPVSGTEN